MAKVNEGRFSEYLTNFGFSNPEQSFLLNALRSSRGPQDMLNHVFSFGFESERANLIGEIINHSLEK